jgi:hypothetical protein
MPAGKENIVYDYSFVAVTLVSSNCHDHGHHVMAAFWLVAGSNSADRQDHHEC